MNHAWRFNLKDEVERSRFKAMAENFGMIVQEYSPDFLDRHGLIRKIDELIDSWNTTHPRALTMTTEV